MNWLSKTKKVMAGVGLGMVLVAGIALANNWAMFSFTVPSALTSVTATPLTNNTGTAMVVPGNTPVTVIVNMWGNSTNVQPVVIGFDGTPDNTNWTTSQPWKFTNNLPGVTNGGLPCQFTADMLRGYQQIKLTYESATSATAITNYGWEGSYFY